MDNSSSANWSTTSNLPSVSNSIGRIYGWQPSNSFDKDGSSAGQETPRLLRLKIYNGQNLAKKDIFGASDPYVRIDLLRKDRTVIDSVYTKTKKKTLNPCWNEEFIFRVNPASHQLLIEVFDENRLTRDDFLGKVELNLNNIPNESELILPKRYTLQRRSSKSKVRGNLEIYHAYIDSHSRLSATNLSDLQSTLNVEESDNEWEVVSNPSHSNENQVNDITDELPSGWEECQDTNGRTYFLNHNTRTTQWERPLNITDMHIAQGQNSISTNQNELNHQQMHEQQQRNFDQAQDFYRRFHIGSSLDESTADQNKPIQPGESNQNISSEYTDNEAVLLSMSANNGNQSVTDSPESGVEPPATQHQLDSETQANVITTSSVVQQNSSDTAISLSNPSGISSANRRHSEPATTSQSEPDRERSTESRPHSHHHQSHHHIHPDRNHSQSFNHSQQSSSNQSPSYNSTRPETSQQQTNSSNNQTVNDDGLGELPPGWSKQSAVTGRIFFIDHNTKTTTWVDPRTGKPSPSPKTESSTKLKTVKGFGKHSAVDDLGPLPSGWEERVHRDGRIFFINHNTRTTQWEDPRLDNPNISGPPILYSRDYKKKYEILQNSLQRPTNVSNKFEIKVNRNSILEDSFRAISQVTRVDNLKAKLWIEFDNEEVLDYGGPCREWFYLLSKEMFNPYYGLFEYSSADKYTLQIKPFSGRFNAMHLLYFKFIGRVAGMAIYHGKLLDAFFIRPFYKMMLGKEITLKDMESVDSEYFNSLKYILENDPSSLYLNFSIDEKFLDVVEEKELKPNGAQIPVTNENKLEYINLVIDWRFVSRVKPQMSAFLEGFHEIIPKNLIEMFDENELELLMCGIGNVDVKDWKQNTVYKGAYHANHIVIQWFWRVVLSFNNEMRSRLLQFVTGTSRVPMNGFKELYGSNGPQLFTIEKWGTPQNLPRSHTCFNRLDLPCYESYSDLRDKLIKAIEGSESYGGVD